jgi:predicted HTH domain antitoxin
VKLQVSPILKYIAEGEHQQQDFKFCINDSRKIARSLVAFANTDGGRLLIGVKDNGRIAGVRSDEEYYMVEAAAKLYSKPALPFESEVWDVDGKMVLEIRIEQGSEKPYMAQSDDGKWFAYLRVNDENMLANSVMLKSWKLNANPTGILFKMDEPRKTLIDFLQSEKQISLNKFSRIAHISRNNAQEILAEFLSMKCIRFVYDNESVLYELEATFDRSDFEQSAINKGYFGQKNKTKKKG